VTATVRFRLGQQNTTHRCTTMTDNEHDYWTFRGRVIEVIDGDTFDMEVDLGFRAQKQIRVRLDGVDTDEIFGVDDDSTEYERGKEQKRWVNDWLLSRNGPPTGWPFRVSTHTESGKYGRWIATIVDPETGDVLNEDLVERFPHVESDYET
jgi:micrococcal nuclease